MKFISFVARRLSLLSCSFALFFVIPISKTSAQGFLRASGDRIVNANGENVLLRGMGLGGWMLQEGYMLRITDSGQQYKIRERIEAVIGKRRTDEFYDAWLSNHTTRADVDSLKSWGFNSIRLPLHYNLFTLPVEQEPQTGNHTWLTKGVALTDSLLAWCKANQVYLILDLHAAPGGQGHDLNISDRDPSKPSLWESEANRQKTIALWRRLAERYANEPWIGGYDIINEPNWGFEERENNRNGLSETSNIPLKQLMVDITKAIREVDTNHIIIIEGNGWGNNYNGILPTWDKNMVLSFHKYWTHNNLESIKHILDYRKQYKIPVWLGESGENSNVWFTDAIRLLEENNVGWAWWPLKKLGNNNPLQVPSNPRYDTLLNYFLKGGRKPAADEAFRGLMQLARQTHISKNIFQADVVDAMMRQPHTIATKPFKSHVLRNKLTIQAVDYDLGRNGYAYFDRDTGNYWVSTGTRTEGNKGKVYRNDGVDIYKTATTPATYCVDAEEGEWLQYTLQVLSSGTCNVQVQLLPDTTVGELQLSINSTVKPPKNIIVNGKANLVDFGNVSLSKGENKLRLIIKKGTLKLAELRVTKV